MYKVTIEGAGKDHYAAGGSREVASTISEEIFKYPNPYNFPYEFFLLGGKKMSTSKGVGVSARQISEALPAEILRFLIARYKPRSAIDFNPDGDTIPRLFDDWDKFAAVYFGKEQVRDPDVPRIFALSQIAGKPKEHFSVPFSFIAFLVQVPSVDLLEAVEKYKGSALNDEEKKELEHRADYAKIWLEKIAGEEAKIRIVDKPDWEGINEKTKKALAEFAECLTLSEVAQGEKIRLICTENGITIQDFFKAAYLIFIGREKGPKLVPFLNALDKKMVEKRLKGE